WYSESENGCGHSIHDPLTYATAGQGHEATYEDNRLQIPDGACGYQSGNWSRVRFCNDHVWRGVRNDVPDAFRQLLVRQVPVLGIGHNSDVERIRQALSERLEQRSSAIHSREQHQNHALL